MFEVAILQISQSRAGSTDTYTCVCWLGRVNDEKEVMKSWTVSRLVGKVLVLRARSKVFRKTRRLIQGFTKLMHDLSAECSSVPERADHGSIQIHHVFLRSSGLPRMTQMKNGCDDCHDSLYPVRGCHFVKFRTSEEIPCYELLEDTWVCPRYLVIRPKNTNTK